MHTFFITLIAVSILMGQAGRFMLGAGVSVYVLEVIIVMHSIYLLLTNKLAWRTYLKPVAVRMVAMWLGYILLLWIYTAFHYTSQDNAQALMYIIRITTLLIYAHLLFQAHNLTVQIHRIVSVLTIGIGLLGLLQYVFLPDLRFLASFGWDPHMYRAVGTILDPPIMGSLLGIGLIYHFDRRNVWGICILTFAIVFLFSRSTYIAISIVMAIYCVLQKRGAAGVRWFLLFVLLVYVAPHTIPARINLESAKITRVSTVMSRSVELQQGIRAWLTTPVWGIGYNRISAYKKNIPQYQAVSMQNHANSAFHSFWLTQLVTTGCIGFGLLVAWLVVLVKNYPPIGVYGMVPAIIGLADNVLFHPFVVVTLVLVMLSHRKLAHARS